MLTLVVGVALAVVPGRAADAAPSLRLVSSTYYVDSAPNPRHIAGEVENDGSTYLAAPSVTIRLYDAANTLLETVVRPTLLTTLAPGERAPFGYGFSRTDYDHHEIGVDTPTATDTPPNHRFTTTATASAADASGFREVSGTVRNDNTAAAQDVLVALTFYDSAGLVRGVAVASPDDGAGDETFNDLAAGQTKSFLTSVVPGFPSFTSVVARAESPSPPSPAPGPLPSPSSAAPSPSPTQASPSPSPSASAVPSADPSPTGVSPSPTAASPSPTPESDCAATVSLSSAEIVVGETVDVILGGRPNGRVVLEGYSRPASAYAPLRPTLDLGPDGTEVITVRPATNTRLRASAEGCTTAAPSALLRVHPVLTFTVRREGVRRYAFEGRILPGAVNAGRTVSLYYRLSGESYVRRAAATVGPGGAFTTTVAFAAPARLDVQVRTGPNAVNEAAASNARSLLVY